MLCLQLSNASIQTMRKTLTLQRKFIDFGTWCSADLFPDWNVRAMMKHLVIVFGLLISLSACGCGKTDRLKRQAISGTITLNGKPLPRGSIEFTPTTNGSPSGASIQDGKYAVPKEKGLPPGDYIVRISASNPDEKAIEVPGESNKISPELIPAKYNTKSTLSFHVDEKEENIFDLNIDKK